ncbi:hypothetical protein C8J57DRAFT_1609907 [Mycena rebaudengoi]|nr:hypothetical protein C8J57DRAFT_1609907 [Mycena rebaudengoi]
MDKELSVQLVNPSNALEHQLRVNSHLVQPLNILIGIETINLNLKSDLEAVQAPNANLGSVRINCAGFQFPAVLCRSIDHGQAFRVVEARNSLIHVKNCPRAAASALQSVPKHNPNSRPFKRDLRTRPSRDPNNDKLISVTSIVYSSHHHHRRAKPPANPLTPRPPAAALALGARQEVGVPRSRCQRARLPPRLLTLTCAKTRGGPYVDAPKRSLWVPPSLAQDLAREFAP